MARDSWSRAVVGVRGDQPVPVVVGLVAVALCLTVQPSCAQVRAKAPSTQADGGADAGTDAGSAGAGGHAGRMAGGLGGAGGTAPQFPPLTDFPSAPVFTDPTIPTNAPGLFSSGPGRAGSAPCISSPEPATLMPRNWLRPRITYRPMASENLFEVTLTIAGFAHPLRVYTRDQSYTLDKDLWNSLRTSINDIAVTVGVRAIGVSGGGTVELAVSAAAQTTLMVAPVDAPGKIVYWALTQNTGSLKGFGIGEEGTQTVLTPAQVQARNPSTENCIGCHAATPDGEAVGFSLGQGFYYDSIADVRMGTAGATPAYVSATALATLRLMAGIPAYSPAHWSAGDRIVLLSDVGDLTWIQVDGTRKGVLARDGDARLATEPTFRHDGTGVVYVSTNSIVQGRAAAGPGDLYQIPYAAGAGGLATPVPGAADPDFTEYYPALSPDDGWIAFTRLAGMGNVYSNTDAEVFVVSANGGTPQRLAANDAPVCETELHSPGMTNDWPKWSPEVGQANGKSYYWLTFSSQRSGVAQLYVTALVVDAAGRLVSYPALHLWNQPPAEGNHTPSWDNVQIPPVIVP
jgi:hypothetical protein